MLPKQFNVFAICRHRNRGKCWIFLNISFTSWSMWKAFVDISVTSVNVIQQNRRGVVSVPHNTLMIIHSNPSRHNRFQYNRTCVLLPSRDACHQVLLTFQLLLSFFFRLQLISGIIANHSYNMRGKVVVLHRFSFIFTFFPVLYILSERNYTLFQQRITLRDLDCAISIRVFPNMYFYTHGIL